MTFQQLTETRKMIRECCVVLQLNAIRVTDIRQPTRSESAPDSEREKLGDFAGDQRRKYPAGSSCVKVKGQHGQTVWISQSDNDDSNNH